LSHRTDTVDPRTTTFVYPRYERNYWNLRYAGNGTNVLSLSTLPPPPAKGNLDIRSSNRSSSNKKRKGRRENIKKKKKKSVTVAAAAAAELTHLRPTEQQRATNQRMNRKEREEEEKEEMEGYEFDDDDDEEEEEDRRINNSDFPKAIITKGACYESMYEREPVPDVDIKDKEEEEIKGLAKVSEEVLRLNSKKTLLRIKEQRESKPTYRACR
jgi:hypothetical protein